MTKLKQIAILDIPSRGHFGGVCSELISALCTAFVNEGVQVEYHRDRIPEGIPTLVFSFYRLFLNGRTPKTLPDNAVVFNLSPLALGEFAWYDNYVRALSVYPVIDYSPANLAYLGHASAGNCRSFRFDFGYAPLNTFTYPARRSSFLFYGNVNDYRAGRLAAMKESGASIQVLSNVWGHERDLQIGMARAVLNLGKFDRNILEAYRLWHSLCLGTPVLSEPGSDPALTAAWEPYVTFQNRLDLTDAGHLELKDPGNFRQNTSMQTSARNLIAFIESLAEA